MTPGRICPRFRASVLRVLVLPRSLSGAVDHWEATIRVDLVAHIGKMMDHTSVSWFRRKQQSTQPGPPIVFFVRLGEENDWSDDEGAWRCPVLRIPAAIVKELRSQGQSLPSERYRVDMDAHLIFWLGAADRPQSLVVRIEISQSLITAKQAEIANRESTVRVAQISAIASIMVAVITGATAFSVAKAKSESQRNIADPAPITISKPRDPGSVPQEDISFDVAQAISSFQGNSCLLSNAGLYPYCTPKDTEDCEREVHAGGGAFAANHHCVKPPKTVFCGAYRSAGSVRTICFSSQEQCDASRLGYRVIPNIDAVSDRCKRVAISAN